MGHVQIVQLARQQGQTHAGVADGADAQGGEADQAGLGQRLLHLGLQGGHERLSIKAGCLYDKQPRHVSA
ncbi:hypothetical protein D3C80_1777050 [compost metagenome]